MTLPANRCPTCSADVTAETADFRASCAEGVSVPGMSPAEAAEAFVADFGIKCQACEGASLVEEANEGSWFARFCLAADAVGPGESLYLLPGDRIGIGPKERDGGGGKKA